MKPVLLAGLLLLSACTAPPTVHHEAKGALGPYSALVEAGDLVFVAGRIGATKAAFEEEVATTLGAVEAELKRVDLTLADVVQATCYLTDMELYARFNAVYAERVPKPWPARAVVAVSALPAGAHVEIAVVARRR
ncbi:MAG: Rid family hydrolase [Planctomycetota bacterium]|nr:Rid family hydrolase [Planctomycetota bacterium]